MGEQMEDTENRGPKDLEGIKPHEVQIKKQKRSAMACVRCRRRHIKCPGGEPCYKCVRAKVSCEYLEADKKVLVSRCYLQKLHEDIAILKRENEDLRASVKQQLNLTYESIDYRKGTNSSGSDQAFETADTGTILNTTVFDNATSNAREENAVLELPHDDDEIVAPFVDQQRKLVYSSTGEKFYVGSSSMTLFGIQVQNMIPHLEKPIEGVPKLTSNETVLEREGNAYRIMLGRTKSKSGISVDFMLPSYLYAMVLVDTSIQYIDGCFYFFNEGLVKENLRRVYEGCGTDSSDSVVETIWFCKILLIFAIGEMYLGIANNINSNKLNDGKLPGSGFFHQASELFTGLFSSGAIDNLAKEGGIEVLLLYAFYLQVADCTVASYFYFGLALRTSLVLGMHVDAEKETLSRFELEHRRRLWWTVYMYERMLSSKAGLPLSLTDNSISTELPSDFDMTNPPPSYAHYIFPEAEYITNCVKITQINAKILSCLYQKQPCTNILPVLAEIVGQLIQWKQNLPEFLSPDFSKKDVRISRLVTNVMSEYFQGMNLAVRPLLFHFVSKQLKENKTSNSYIDLSQYSKSIITLFKSSFQASINTIRSLWSLMAGNLVALFGYLDREYLFTSAVTLILFNAAFGLHQTTYDHLDHALQIFTKMRNLGNHPADLRRAQLLKLMSKLDFNDLMSNMIQKFDDNLEDSQLSFSVTSAPMESEFKESYLPTSHATQKESLVRQLKKLKSGNIMEPPRMPEASPILHSTEAYAELPETAQFLQEDAVTSGDTELWKEISTEAIWLSSLADVSEGFQGLVDDMN